MPLPGAKPAKYQLITTLEIYELNGAVAELVSISTFERRTGQDNIFPIRIPLLDPYSESREPWGTVAIVQRDPSMNFVDVTRRVKIVGIGKLPAESLCQELTDCGLARTHNAHENDDQCCSST